MKKISFILLLSVLVLSCQKEVTTNIITSIPTVITASVTAITSTTAVSGGTVTDDGGDTLRARGVCWDTAPNPTISGNHTTDGFGIGVFTSNITGLTSGNTYYVRAYATNDAGTAYGNEFSFSTLEPDIYVVGQQSGINNANAKATIWKNGVAAFFNRWHKYCLRF